jgi:hypothetical protein
VSQYLDWTSKKMERTVETKKEKLPYRSYPAKWGILFTG